MATLAYPANLQTAQTGNADSTNVVQRPFESNRQVILRIVSTIGATPTVTVNIKGSIDGTTFYNIPYSVLSVAPNGYSVAPLVITTAVTSHYALMQGQSWNFIKLVMTLNTNVTLTSDVL